MDLDMDIDMDLGIDPAHNEMELETLTAPEMEIYPSLVEGVSVTDLVDFDKNGIAVNKVHLRGLDNLTSADIKSFALTYFPNQSFEKIEWIDDTSANLVYGTPEYASQALAAFIEVGIDHELPRSHKQTFPAKLLPTHPEIRLRVRLAVLGDRKQAGARERSRFYLLNPEHDRVEQRKREGSDEGRGRYGRKYRDRDDYAQRKREDRNTFDASLYDDGDIVEAVRAAADYSRKTSVASISSGGYRGQGIRKIRYNGGVGKELFPNRVTSRRRGGTLRDQSASPSRDSDVDRITKSLELDQSNSSDDRVPQNSSANRIQAKIIKTRLKDSNNGAKELFPEKSSSNHRRSGAIDAADATADLFASKISIPFLDGTSDTSPREMSLDSRMTKSRMKKPALSADASRDGFNIKGLAEQHQGVGIAIKGTAISVVAPIKELFPSKIGLNSGKELFAEKLEGRGGRRQRAEDMFY